MSVTVLLADDHPIVRQGLRRLLENQPDLKVVGEASDGLEAVHLAGQLKPDVLVLDLTMPALNGLEAARQVRERSPSTRIIILSVHSSEMHVLQALRNGACGYILKDTGPSELVEAIHKVIRGERYLSPPLEKRLIDALVRMGGAANEPYDQLTGRERELLQLSAEGLTTNEIAARLSISPRTVETHRANLMEKLGLHNQTDLVRYALKRGIISFD